MHSFRGERWRDLNGHEFVVTEVHLNFRDLERDMGEEPDCQVIGTRVTGTCSCVNAHLRSVHADTRPVMQAWATLSELVDGLMFGWTRVSV